MNKDYIEDLGQLFTTDDLALLKAHGFTDVPEVIQYWLLKEKLPQDNGLVRQCASNCLTAPAKDITIIHAEQVSSERAERSYYCYDNSKAYYQKLPVGTVVYRLAFVHWVATDLNHIIAYLKERGYLA